MTTATRQITLPTRIRAADGRIYDGPMDLDRHRSVHLELLHGHHTDGYLELCPGTRPPGGKVVIDRRKQPTHYVALGRPDWLEGALRHAQWIVEGRHPSPEPTLRFDPPREEVFVGVTARTDRQGRKAYVARSDWLWVDVDEPDELPKLWAFLEQRPAHIVVFSGGSGGAHAYWRLASALPAYAPDGNGEAIEWIERANQRIIHHLGHWTTVLKDGRPRPKFVGADRVCADRNRVMRLAGTQNWKTGAYARVAWADFALPGYEVAALVGDLPDMPDSKAAARQQDRRRDAWGPRRSDPYKAIPPSDYFQAIAGITVPRYGNVSCPHPDHDDRNPSCRVGGLDEGWLCHGCGAGGGIYDLASAVLGGPTRQALRGEAFKRAARKVRDVYGPL